MTEEVVTIVFTVIRDITFPQGVIGLEKVIEQNLNYIRTKFPES